MEALRYPMLAVFALLCGAGWYSNYEGSHHTLAAPDATHTRLIQYGRGGGGGWVTLDQLLRWELSWVVIDVLLIAFVVIFFIGWRRRRGPWDRRPS